MRFFHILYVIANNNLLNLENGCKFFLIIKKVITIL